MENVPKLQDDVQISPMDTAAHEPQYLLRNGKSQQFQISSSLQKILTLIDGKRTLSEIAEAFSQETGKPFTEPDVERLIDECLVPRGIVATTGTQPSLPKMNSYMRIRVPLFSQAMIAPFTKLFQHLFWPPLMIGALLMAGISELLFISEGLEVSLESLTLTDILTLYGLFMGSILFHELGHSSACYRFGARHGAIGLGVYWVFPVLYADVSDVWRLRPSERVVVDFGGIYFQLLTIPFSGLAYLVSHYPLWMYLIYATNLSILTSLNPLFRFDGYWIVSDIIGVPNLRRRSQETYRGLFGWLTKTPGTTSKSTLLFGPRTRLFLYLYMILSNVFFLIFLILLVPAVVELIRSYPQTIRDVVTNLPIMFSSHNWKELLASLSKLSSKSFVLIVIIWGVGKMCFQVFMKNSKATSHGQ